jgi:cytoskeletal protein CcmA (bactofilin family)
LILRRRKSGKRRKPNGDGLPGSVSEIGPRAAFVGEVRGGGDLVVNGRLDGAVQVGGRVEIGPAGAVRDRIAARELWVAGRFEGGFEVDGRIHAVQGSSLSGSGTASIWQIESGARLDLDVHATRRPPTG